MSTAAYLRRLGLEREAPGVEALVRLHRAQVERVPYETVWIHQGRSWGIEPARSVRRIAAERRGGYCYHLNGAFSRLLGVLGYDVSRHVGGVHGPDGPAEASMTNHLVLLVSGLPTDDNPGGRWFVDAGLGDALHEPLPLVPGTYRQGPFTFRLEATPGGVGDWHFVHDRAGSFSGMSFREAPATMAEFGSMHRFLARDPASNFTRFVVVQRRHGGGTTGLRGRSLEGRVLDRDEWFQALADEFGIVIAGGRPAEALWRRVERAHQHWLASRSGA